MRLLRNEAKAVTASRDGDSGAASQRHPSQCLQWERKRAVRGGSRPAPLGSRWGWEPLGHQPEVPVMRPVISQVREPGNHGRHSELRVREP